MNTTACSDFSPRVLDLSGEFKEGLLDIDAFFSTRLEERAAQAVCESLAVCHRHLTVRISIRLVADENKRHRRLLFNSAHHIDEGQDSVKRSLGADRINEHKALAVPKYISIAHEAVIAYRIH